VPRLTSARRADPIVLTAFNERDNLETIRVIFAEPWRFFRTRAESVARIFVARLRPHD
jgi:hypothetical protein